MSTPAAQYGVVGAAEDLGVAGSEGADDGGGLGGGRVDVGVEGVADPVADGFGEVVIQTGGVAPGTLGRLVLGDPAHGGAEVRVLGEFSEFHPGVDLLRFRVVRQVGRGGTHHLQEVGVGSTPPKVSSMKSLLSHRRSPSESFASLCMRSVSSGVEPRLGYHSQHRAPQSKGADLNLQSVGMRCRDLGHQDLPVPYLPYDSKVEPQVT